MPLLLVLASAALRPPLTSSLAHTPRAPPVRAIAGGRGETTMLKLTQPSRDRASALDVLTWNYVSIGEEAFEGRSVFGDGIAKVSPVAATQLSETMRDGCFKYVFSGQGTVLAAGKSYKVGPNTLVEVSAPSGATELTWTAAKGCKALVLGSSEYDSPARVFVRAALPYLFGALSLAAGLVVLSGGLDS